MARWHDLSRNLVRVRVEKYERGDFDGEHEAADLLEHYEARIASLERLVERLTLENEMLKWRCGTAGRPRLQAVRHFRPRGLGIAEGCRVMGVARSSFYSRSRGLAGDTALVARMGALCDEFPAYGYRRVAAQLRADGLPVNSKRVPRLMALHGLQPRRRQRRVGTTGRDHDGPIFPNLARNVVPDGPDRLWVADVTYVATWQGFAHLAVILDARSRRVVGCALGRMLDARSTLAALRSVHTATRQGAGSPRPAPRAAPPGGSGGRPRRVGGAGPRLAALDGAMAEANALFRRHAAEWAAQGGLADTA